MPPNPGPSAQATQKEGSLVRPMSQRMVNRMSVAIPPSKNELYDAKSLPASAYAARLMSVVLSCRKGRRYQTKAPFSMCRKSCPSSREQGTRYRVTPVANRTPKARDTAMGMRNCACNERSKSNGSKPTKVVTDVSMIGRNRRAPASSAASRSEAPSARRRLT